MQTAFIGTFLIRNVTLSKIHGYPSNLEWLFSSSKLSDNEKEKRTVCESDECKKMADTILGAMNRSADPCDDFYEYACGKWPEQNPIPEGYAKWSMSMMLAFIGTFLIRNVTLSKIHGYPSHLEWLFSSSKLSDNEEEKRTICESEECKKMADTLLGAMNRSADPCDDFYEYACGKWPEQNPIPEGYPKWSMSMMLFDKTNEEIKEIITAEPMENELRTVKLAKKWFKACTDTDAMEKQGIDPLVSTLSRLGGWPMIMEPDKWNEQEYSWQKVDNRYMRLLGRNAFYDVRVQINDTNVVQFFAEIITAEPMENELRTVKLAKKLFKACMDTDAMEKQGIDPLVSTLSRLGGWPMIMEPDKWNEQEYSWQKVDDRYMRLLGRNAFYDVGVQINDTNVVEIDLPHLPPGSDQLRAVIKLAIEAEETGDSRSDEDPKVDDKRAQRFSRREKVHARKGKRNHVRKVHRKKTKKILDNGETVYTTAIPQVNTEETNEDDENETELLQQYANYISKVARVIAKEEDTKISEERLNEDIKDMIEFQLKLIQISPEVTLESLSNPVNMQVTLGGFQQWFNKKNSKTANSRIDWVKKIKALFDEANESVDDNLNLDIIQPSYIANLVSLLDETSSRTIVNYIHWNFISRIIKTTTSEMRALYDFWETAAEGTEPSDRVSTCMQSAEIKEILGYEFVKKYFSDDLIETASNLLSDIRKAVEYLIKESDWMDDKAKDFALAKVKHLKKFIGYPKWYKNTTVIQEYYEGVSFQKFAFIGVLLLKNATPSKNLGYPSRLNWLFGVNNEPDKNKEENEEKEKKDDKPTVCLSQECKKIARIISESMNKSEDPCDDFYEYACGKWPEHNPIPNGLKSWSMFRRAQINVQKQIKEILDEGPKKNDLLAVKLAKKWYAVCMNTDAMERYGLEPLVFTLSRIGGWPLIMEQDEWNEQEYSWQKVDDQYVRLTGRNAFYDVSVVNIDYDSNETRKVVYIDIPDLPTGSNRLWSETDSEEEEDKSDEDTSNEQKDSQEPGSKEKNDDKSGNNRNDENEDDNNDESNNNDDEKDNDNNDKENNANDTNEQNDDDNAKKKVSTKRTGKLAKNKKLGHGRKMKSNTHSKNNHHKTKKERIKKRAIPTNIGEKLRVWKTEKNHVKQKRIERPKETLKATTPQDNTKEIIDEDNDLKKYVNYISKVARAIAKTRGVEVLEEHMDKDIQDMIEFQVRLAEITAKADVMRYRDVKNMTLNDFQKWYDEKKPKTPNSAINWVYKIGELFDEAHVQIGDDLTVGIRRQSYFRDLVALLDKTSSRTIESNWMDEDTKDFVLAKLVNLNKFIGYPDWFKNNTKNDDRPHNAISAADFQSPLFAYGRPQVINYGIIGTIMGHEVNHGFDNNGHLFDKNGNVVEWLSAMAEAYGKRAECFVEQFNNYSIDKTSNYTIENYGNQTAGENIADTMGLEAAFRAYQRRQRECGKPDTVLPGLENLTNDQLFFLSFANLCCEAAKINSTINKAKRDPHSPGRLRIIGSVSNSQDFAEAYNCPVGSAMNPEKKCHIWNAFIGVLLVKNAAPSNNLGYSSRLDWLFGVNNEQDENKKENKEKEKKDDKPTVCQSQECRKIARIISESMDKSADPCDDFYEYACGKWPEHNPIPNGLESWRSFLQIVIAFIGVLLVKNAAPSNNLGYSSRLDWLFGVNNEQDENKKENKEKEKKDDKPTVCQSQECRKIARIISESMDKSADPCDDFYEYACGKWPEHNPIPNGLESWSMFRRAQINVQKQIKEILDEGPKKNDLLAVKLAKKWYAVCMDTDATERDGLEPLVFTLSRIGGWPLTMEQDEWNEQEYSWQKVDDQYVRLTGRNAFHDINIPDLPTGSNRLWSKTDSEEKEDERDENVSDEQKDSQERGSKEKNDDKSGNNKNGENGDDNNDNDESVNNNDNKDNDNNDEENDDIDTNEQNDDDNAKKKTGKLAKNKKLKHSRKIKTNTHSKNNHHKTKKEEIKKRAIPTNIREKLRVWKTEKNHVKQERIKRPKETLEATTSQDNTKEMIDEDNDLKKYANYISKVARAIAKTRGVEVSEEHMDKDIQDMIEFQLKLVEITAGADIIRYRDVESMTLNNFQKWYDKKKPKTPNSAINWVYKIGELFDEAHVQIGDDLTVGISQQNYFKDLVALLDKTSSRTIESNWMDENTKDFVLAKLVNLDKFIGYPDWFKNNTKLVTGKSYYENILSYDRYSKWKSLRELLEDDEGTDDTMMINPTTVDAYFSPGANSIAISAADFQSPLFAYGRPQVINYGIIGMIMGHEVNHGFDNRGHLYDKNGNAVEWLSAMAEAYGKRAECFVEQFNNYSIDKTSNYTIENYGNQTAGENIADTMGLEAAFKAYQRRQRECGKPDTVLPGLEDLTNDQLFFLSFANLCCEAAKMNSTINKAKRDPHSPGRLRIIGSVSNSQDFAEAYNCPIGSAMNPSKKCHIWKIQ
ncbi:hypothetical protein DBV15_08331 [Temnothorax longispinosus]|uniref:Endothelin-converting enzyme 1 n=1 Tax=Temnothorax longispinosus TaxID=300112 RepID=A0A4S2L4W0_9HYME|nr:hypothetical protein DBV15_08331 [Temnothorax longispinosus]